MSDQSRGHYGDVEVPDFKSTIPAHLLGKLSDSERYMVETMSKLERQSQWLVDVVVKGSAALAAVGEKVKVIEAWKDSVTQKVEKLELVVAEARDKVAKLWDWHQMLSGKWAVLWALLMIVIPIVLKLILDMVIKKGP